MDAKAGLLEFLNDEDNKISSKINEINSDIVRKINNVIGNRAVLIFLGLAILVSVLIFAKNWFIITKTGILAVLLGIAINELLLKRYNFGLLNRKRPYIANKYIKSRGLRLIDSSFPSSHVALVVAVGTVLVYFYYWLLPITVVFCLLVGFGRIYSGMHYLSDVLGGAVIGIIEGYLGIFLGELRGLL